MRNRNTLRKRKSDLGQGLYICSLISYQSHKRGERGEQKVAIALSALQRKGVIQSFTQFPPNAPEQRQGIDFQVTTLDNRIVSFQVKSSVCGVVNHNRRHPSISAVVVQPEMRQSKIERLLCQKLALPHPPA